MTVDMEREVQIPDGLDMDDDGDDGDDGDDAGWLVVFNDGRHVLIGHDEDKSREEVVKQFFDMKRKDRGALLCNETVIDVSEVKYFGWSENGYFPEIAQFDSVQERIEGLVNAVTLVAERVAFLAENQAALQAAQAQLFQEEVAELHDAEVAAAEVAASAAGATSGKKSGFRPPRV